MAEKATGANALLAVLVDAPSSLYAVGHPGVDIHAITPPVDPLTAAAGAAGNLTGDFVWRVAFGDESGAMTSPGPWSSDTFAGAGLNDIVWSGAFTGDTWVVTISTAAGTDQYTWTKNGGAASAPVTMVAGTAQLLSDGVYVTFPAQTGHTLADAWTRGAALTLTADIGGLSAIPTSSDTKCDRRVIERAEIVATVLGAAAVCGRVYDASTTNTFDDNVATLDASDVIPSVNMTGANGGFVFLEPDSFEIDPDFTSLPIAALTGSAGAPPDVPGPIKIAGTFKSDLRTVDLAPLLYAGAGIHTSLTKVAGEPTNIRVWNASTSRRTPRTISMLSVDGSADVPPTLLWQLGLEEIDFSFSGGKIDDISPKFTGCNYTIHSWATQVAGTGTWPGAFVLMGQRFDSPGTDPIRIKITQTLTADTVKFKVTRGSGGSYTGAEYTLYADAADRQTKGGNQYNEGCELSDETGVRLGADSENRQPLLVYATAPFTTDLAVNDIFEFANDIPIPGTGTTPYSGFPALFPRGSRFTDAHVTLYSGSSVIEATAGTLKLKFPKKDVNSLCPGARSLQDLPNEGFRGAELSITRYLDSDAYRTLVRANSYVVAQVALDCGRILINPGTYSTYREGLVVDIPYLKLTSVKAPKSGQGLVVETIAGVGRQPVNPALDLFTITLTSSQGCRVPA